MKKRAMQPTSYVIGSLVVSMVAALVVGTNAMAANVPIVTYDILGTPRSGFGCWTHYYTGFMTNTGRTISGSVNCTSDGNQIANYTGGGGTLNDEFLSGGHLLFTRNDDAGVPINPVITLHLNGTVLVDEIQIISGGGGPLWPGQPWRSTAPRCNLHSLAKSDSLTRGACPWLVTRSF